MCFNYYRFPYKLYYYPCMYCPLMHKHDVKSIDNKTTAGLYRHHKKQKVPADIVQIKKLFDCFYPGLGNSKYINCIFQAELSKMVQEMINAFNER